MYDSTCIDRVKEIATTPFGRVSYTEAIDLLEKAVADGKEFVYPVSWGIDLATEHERWLAEEHFKKPVIVYNYPKDIKAFYMRLNDDNKTVAAMDVLVPKVGELIGGSNARSDWTCWNAEWWNVTSCRKSTLGTWTCVVTAPSPTPVSASALNA